MPDRTDSALTAWQPAGLCSMFVCDIVSFGHPDRVGDARARLRQTLYAGLRSSFDISGIPYDCCYREDRGDGVMMIVPPQYDTSLLITSVVERLSAAVRRHNELASKAARLQLRVAVNTGQCRSDGNGLVSDALTHAFRLMEAAPLKQALRDSEAWVGLIVSQRVHDDVVRHGPDLVDPGEYRRIDAEVKETAAPAWIRLLGSSAVAVRAHRIAGREPAGGYADRDLFELVDQLLDIPLLHQERGRDQVVGALPINIAGVIPRSSQARFDVYAIVRTCLDYPGGLHQLLSAIHGFVGDSIQMYRLEQVIAHEG